MTPDDLGFAHKYVPGEGDGGDVTLLLLHGTGGDENDLLDIGRAIAPGAALLSPRGKVLEQGAPRFFRRLAEGVFDLQDLRFRAGELADFVAAAASKYGFDASRLYAVGFSNGANIAAATLLLRPEALAGGVLLRAMVPLTPDVLPDLRGKSVLIESGRHDPIVPPDQPETLAELLRSAGADVALQWHAASHGLTPRDIAVAQAWMAT